MAEYQNIFTRVQVRAPAYVGVPPPSEALGSAKGRRSSLTGSAASATLR